MWATLRRTFWGVVGLDVGVGLGPLLLGEYREMPGWQWHQITFRGQLLRGSVADCWHSTPTIAYVSLGHYV